MWRVNFCRGDLTRCAASWLRRVDLLPSDLMSLTDIASWLYDIVAKSIITTEQVFAVLCLFPRTDKPMFLFTLRISKYLSLFRKMSKPINSALKFQLVERNEDEVSYLMYFFSYTTMLLLNNCEVNAWKYLDQSITLWLNIVRSVQGIKVPIFVCID